MTTPENEDAPTAETPVPTAPAPAPAPAAGPPPMAFGPPLGPSPWVAPPRERWINPAKRTPAIIAGVVAALVLLGVGGVVGAAIGHHDHGGRVVRFVPADGNFRPVPFGGKIPHGKFENPPGRNLPTPSPTKTS